MMSIQTAIEKVSTRQHLSQAEAYAAMSAIMTGQATPAQIGGYLMGLRLKGETVEEITGSAQAMREVVNRVSLEQADNVIDTCGTGGDGAATFNISTTVAFVAAAAGIPVAKHGNKAISSRSGSADLLSALGIEVRLTPEQVADCIKEVGIGFMFAPNFHPAMKHAIGPRRELGVRTIFNILGPLTNPAQVRRQVMGVFDGALTEPLIGVFQALGSERVLVVHGAGGLDELSTLGPNKISELRDGQIETYELDPVELGLKRAALNDIQGGDAEENAKITREILNGGGTTAQREIVMLNAAAALVVGGCVDSLEEGLHQAAQILDSKRGLEKIEALADKTQRYTKEAV